MITVKIKVQARNNTVPALDISDLQTIDLQTTSRYCFPGTAVGRIGLF